jgi:hypothetical protein
MSYGFESRLGEQLYHLLPAVYRTRDKYPQKPGEIVNEDLARYLDAHGALLDLIHATLEQQLQDTLPQSSQEWLLPYFAQLLAVNIVSPDEDGKHAEVANAIGWRQRKGTLKVAEQIAEAVGQLEAEIQEGWQRVAMTARIGIPLVPVAVTDNTLELDMNIPSQAARHPGLPAVTVDLRRPSRAVEAVASNPAARVSTFAGIKQTWRQQHRHGVPCFPGSFDDVSRRTVDLRRPQGEHGRYHHKSLLAFVPPPQGLIPFEPIELTWAERIDPLYEHLFDETTENGITVIRNNTERRVRISDDVVLGTDAYRIEGIDFDGELKTAAGALLELQRVEAGRVDVPTFSSAEAVLVASDSLFGELSSGGHVELEACSVLDQAFITSIDARDCLFMDIVGADVTGMIEFSRVPAGAPFSADAMTMEDCSTNDPEFFANQTALDARAVLAPDTPASIYAGASENTQMGYFRNGRKGRPVRIEGDFTGADALTLPTEGGYPLTDVIFAGDVEVASGRLELQRAAFASLTLATGLLPDDLPALDAVDSLFGDISIVNGLVRLEYCTVLGEAACKQLQASDCLFTGSITDGAGAEPESGCLRYSRLPSDLNGTTLNVGSGFGSTNTREKPVFAKFDFCTAGAHEYRIADFGEPGSGVLDPVTPDAIRFGAEEGGEMGAGHHRYYSLKIEAVLDKLREFLPVGIDPVLIYDRRLLKVPPQTKSE